MKRALVLLTLCAQIFAFYIEDKELLSAQPSGMLFPQESETREIKDISGIWTFKLDLNNTGLTEQWFLSDLPEPVVQMPVPSSYNDIYPDAIYQKFIGWAWYQTYFRVPPAWQNPYTRVVLRFGSAHYYTMVWINGEYLTEHNGGHLPFEGEITKLFNETGWNRLTVAVNNTLSPSTLPPGKVIIYDGTDGRHPKGYTVQETWFDFYNYAGIHRPVLLYTTPFNYIDDVTINYQLTNNGALVNYDIVVVPNTPEVFTVKLLDEEGNLIASSSDTSGSLQVPEEQLTLWEPGSPYLYTLEIHSGTAGSSSYDVYRLNNVGIRTIQVTKTQFLINNKPFYFHGVDKHEDADTRGKGFDNVLLTKDFALLEWLGANAVRTSHYPYAEEFYFEADRRGIVIIGECPAVGLNIADFFNSEILQHHYDVMYEMIRRDKNHPSVVMWNVANEPDSSLSVAKPYFQNVANYTRSIDPTHRPITLVQSADLPGETCAEFFDVACINRYFAWYADEGDIDLIELQLSNDLDEWYSTYQKPIIVSEYGADTLPGLYTFPPVMFTTEFQLEFNQHYQNVFDAKRNQYLVGELIWNFADFKTGQSTIRVGGQNRKGVLSRNRDPKASAYMLRERYHRLGAN